MLAVTGYASSYDERYNYFWCQLVSTFFISVNFASLAALIAVTRCVVIVMYIINRPGNVDIDRFCVRCSGRTVFLAWERNKFFVSKALAIIKLIHFCHAGIDIMRSKPLSNPP